MNDADVVKAVFPLDVRAADLEQRTIEGIVVPYNETSYLTPDPAGERFLPGSLSRTVKDRGSRIKLFRNHDHREAFGTRSEWDPNDSKGLWARFHVPPGAARDEFLNDVAQGLLDAFSVGFRPIRTRRAQDGAREIQEAALHEVSVAPLAAYDGARVLAVRTPAAVDLAPMPAVDLTPIPPLPRWE
jgi:uncharacterized protein